MATKRFSECSGDERALYLSAYLETVELLSTAEAKFNTLVPLALNAVDASLYKAQKLEAKRALSLLPNQWRDFKNDLAQITPPDAPTVDRIAKAAEDLAKIMVATNNLNAMVGILVQGKAVFDALNPSPTN